MPYFVTNEVRALLTGSTSDASYDALISQEGPYADLDVENDLYAYASASPPFAGADLTNDIKGASNWKAAARIYGILHQFDSQKKANEEYLRIMGIEILEDGARKIIGGIIGRFKAMPTARTAIGSYTTPYRSSPLKDE